MNERVGRAARALLLLLFVACTSRDAGGSSSATNFLACSDDSDCLAFGGVRCDGQGYCVDGDGERLPASTPEVDAGAADAANPPQVADASSGTDATTGGTGGTIAPADSGAAGTAGTAAAEAASRSSRIACVRALALRHQDAAHRAGAGRARALRSSSMFEDGSRVRLIAGAPGSSRGPSGPGLRRALECGPDFGRRMPRWRQ